MKISIKFKPTPVLCCTLGILCVLDSIIDVILLIDEPIVKINRTVLNIGAWCSACLLFASLLFAALAILYSVPRLKSFRERCPYVSMANATIQLLAIVALICVIWLGFLKPSFLSPLLRYNVEAAVLLFIYSHFRFYDPNEYRTESDGDTDD